MKRRHNTSWLDATKIVLSNSTGAMCQTQILQKISDLGLKDTRVPNSGEKVMRALLANSSGKNPIITKVEDQKFVYNGGHTTTSSSTATGGSPNEQPLAVRRHLPPRRKAKAMSEDFVDSDSLLDPLEDRIVHSSYNFESARKSKRMRTKPVSPRGKAGNTSYEPTEENRSAVQEMFNGNSDIMKYELITKKVIQPEEFTQMSRPQQRYLSSLLPCSDVKKERSVVRLQATALSNPFFVSFFREWQDKLGKGELSVDFKAKIQAEVDKKSVRDPWKDSFFEDIWGLTRPKAETSSRSRRDSFEDTVKSSLALVPSSFYMAPLPTDSLTPPTSDGSEHDRSHAMGTELDKELNILTPDHEVERMENDKPFHFHEDQTGGSPIIVSCRDSSPSSVVTPPVSYSSPSDSKGGSVVTEQSIKSCIVTTVTETISTPSAPLVLKDPVPSPQPPLPPEPAVEKPKMITSPTVTLSERISNGPDDVMAERPDDDVVKEEELVVPEHHTPEVPDGGSRPTTPELDLGLSEDEDDEDPMRRFQPEESSLSFMDEMVSEFMNEEEEVVKAPSSPNNKLENGSPSVVVLRNSPVPGVLDGVNKLAVADDISPSSMDAFVAELKPPRPTPAAVMRPALPSGAPRKPIPCGTLPPPPHHPHHHTMMMRHPPPGHFLPPNHIIRPPPHLHRYPPPPPVRRAPPCGPSYSYQDLLLPAQNLSSLEEEEESDLRRISLQQRLLAEKGIKTQPDIEADRRHNTEMRNALKAKLSQRKYSELPDPPTKTTQNSGNHCCYVVRGATEECVCSTAPMLFCTKCYHLSHASCSNVLCSNCGALFKFN